MNYGKTKNMLLLIFNKNVSMVYKHNLHLSTYNVSIEKKYTLNQFNITLSKS